MVLSPIPAELRSALRCPDDGAGPPVPDPDGLRCPACGRAFPLRTGVLRMMPRSAAESEAERRELAAEARRRDHEAEAYDRLLGLRLFTLFEAPALLRPLRSGPSDRVLELGCGTGRLTTRLAGRCEALIGVDHSAASLELLRRKLPSSERVLLVQGELSRLPVRDGWATRGLACSVLQHLPSEALRRAALSELHRALEPRARLALSAYRYSPALAPVAPREGHHSGEIFFHRFTRKELRALISPAFEVTIHGWLPYVWTAAGIRR
ncbi:MAG: methyltransferase domain-containing protein [Armatimonadota bacterium]